MTEDMPKTAAPRVAPRFPKMAPPPFPPGKPRLFARTPPAIFPSILGMMGLGIALRGGFAVMAIPGDLVEVALGAMLAYWAFALLALAVKVMLRPLVMLEDLRGLPGRAGYAAASMSVMVAALVVLPYSAAAATFLVYASLVLHVVIAAVMIRALLASAPEMRGVTPIWHLSFVGFIVAAVPAMQLGMVDLANGILWATVPVAVGIWAVSAFQLITRIPPPPLRPLLAIHLSPAALFVTVSAGLGYGAVAQGFAIFGGAILFGLLIKARWITEAGFSALWGAFTFPLAAFASALMALGGVAEYAGLAVLLGAIALVPMVAWRVLLMWPGGKLAAKTGASQA